MTENRGPTEQEIQSLWEWCGLSYTAPYWVDGGGALAFYGEVYSELLGSITLDNLFKWAVPKLQTRQGHKSIHFFWNNFHCPDEEPPCCCDVNLVDFIMQVKHRACPNLGGEGLSNNPALALFWALREVLCPRSEDVAPYDPSPDKTLIL